VEPKRFREHIRDQKLERSAPQQEEWNAFMDDAHQALDKFKVPGPKRQEKAVTPQAPPRESGSTLKYLDELLNEALTDTLAKSDRHCFIQCHDGPCL
jgi:hypothetical protein